jgi:hypothetical protein
LFKIQRSQQLINIQSKASLCERVLIKAIELDAVPFDLPNMEYTHYDDQCTFDCFIEKHRLKDAALDRIVSF